MNPKLKLAQEAVACAQAEIAADNAVVQAVEDQRAALQRQIDQLLQLQAAKHLHAKLATAQAELALAEEEALTELNVRLAAEIMKRQASDPLAHHSWIVAQVTRLRSSVRSGLDTPNDQKYSLHPIIKQALDLLPPLDDLDRPVYELGGSAAAFPGKTDWPSRRRRILADAEAA